MYLDHFGLRTDPFPLYPSLKFVFLSTPFEEAMAHLAYGLEQEEDIILISGPIGTGKTLAVQSLLANLAKRYQTAFVNVTHVDFPELLKLILADLGSPMIGPADRADLLGGLKAQVQAAQARGQKILIVVDEAQNLSMEALEGLRMLTNLGQPLGQAVQLVLTGQPDLERKINLPELAQLRQRIRVHYRLETLDRREVEAYIAHRVKIAGVERALFRPKALDLIHRASFGVPRLVNILASRALLSAYVAGRNEVDVEHVDIDDLPPATGVAPEAPAQPAAKAPSAPKPAPAPEPTTPERPAPTEAAVPGPAPAPTPRPRPAAPAPAVKPAPAVAETMASSFSPTAAYARRNRRGTLYFLLAVGVLVIGAVIVFTLKPGGFAGQAPVGQESPAGRVADRPSPAGSAPPASAPVEAPPRWTPPGATTADGASPARAEPIAVAPAPAAPKPIDSPPAAARDDGAALRPTPERAATPPPSADQVGGAVAAAASVGATVADTVFAVHVHSFTDLDRTNDDLAIFRAAGFPVFFRDVLVDGDKWRRVYVGPYASSSAAQDAAASLRERGLTTYALIVRLGHGAP